MACAGPQPSPAPTPPTEPPANGERVEETDVSGDFQLTVSLPASVRADQPIEGTATLESGSAEAITISGSGSGIVFEYAEVDGDRRVMPVWTDDCQPYQLTEDDPLESELTKSGAVDSEFAEQFLEGPDIRLPAGEWRISAIVNFFEGPSCTGQRHSMSASVVIQVDE
jgi:hypothetical protein